MTKLQVEGKPIELVAVCDVYNENRDKAAAYIEKETGRAPAKYEDYLEMIAKEKLDGVTIGTPDHIEGWSAGDHGSVLEEPDYMKLAGPWIDGKAGE